MKIPGWLGLLMVALLGAPQTLLACVGCREPGTDTLAKESPTVMAGMAFSWSILFMLAFVMMILVGVSFYIWHTSQRLNNASR